MMSELHRSAPHWQAETLARHGGGGAAAGGDSDFKLDGFTTVLVER